MTVILGLNAYHGDAAAALVVDGELVAAAEEERFNRVKHCAGFPALASAWCLADAGITASDLDHVAVGRNPRANLGAKVRRTLRHRPGITYIRERLSNQARVGDVRRALSDALEVKSDSLRAAFHNVEHHRAHVASAFYVSPFEDAAVLSLDGFGDFASTMLAVGKDTKLEVLDRVLFPHSLGILYTAVSQWLGFTHYGDEGKVMGLAPYGEPIYLDRMSELVRLGSPLFELELAYFTHHSQGIEMTWSDGSPTVGRLFSSKMENLLGPARQPEEPVAEHHQNVARSLQAMLEDAYLHVLNTLWERTGIPRLCLAGGVALNAVANGRIVPDTPFEELYVQAAAGDSGTAVGAAYHVWNEVLSGPRGFVMAKASTGPEYSQSECDAAILAADVFATTLGDDELFPFVAERIAEGDIVGWFQGRMEFGPRALGNRSLLADPRRADMKDILNARIKRREAFRPFAPSILAEATGDWFERDEPSPFMVLVFKLRKEKRELVPAITHVDGTGRLQTVDEEIHPRYHRLIAEFAKQTGVPILLNTSFNDNEPIVMTPAQAIETFLRTKMDLLVLGNRVIRRGP